MGYSHGKKWNDERLEQEIKEVMQKAKIDSMPTHSIIASVNGNFALSNAIRRHGGTRYWADKLGLEIKSCESAFGYDYECECMNYLISKFDYECELTKARYPYDILVNNNIKVDVKCGHLYKGKQGSFYTFNLEKSKPTCDIYVCYCLNDEKIVKTYVIPSCVLSGKTQLSVGVNTSKYDKYIDSWGIFPRYNDFYTQIIS